MSDEKKLLIVDDVEELRDSLADSFEDRGFVVLTAENGEEAIELIKNEPVQFVLSDIKMPKLDGVGLLKAIKDHNPDMPVVLLMSGYSDYNRDDVVDLGALDLVDKPFDFDKVAEMIRQSWGEVESTS